MSYFLIDSYTADFVKAKPGEVRKVIEKGIRFAKKHELPMDKRNLANLGIHDTAHTIAYRQFGDKAKIVLPPTNKAYENFVKDNNLTLKDKLKAKNLHSYKYKTMLMATPENISQNNYAEDFADGLEGLKNTVNTTDNPTRAYWLGRRYRKKVKNDPDLNLLKKVQAYRATEIDDYLETVGKISKKDPVRRIETLPYKIKRKNNVEK